MKKTRASLVPVVGLVDVNVGLIPTDELRAFSDRMAAELRRRHADERGFANACAVVRSHAQHKHAPAKVSVVGARIVCEAVCEIVGVDRNHFAERAQAWIDSP